MMSFKCFISQRLKRFGCIPVNYTKKNKNQETILTFFLKETWQHSDLQVPQLSPCVHMVELLNAFCFEKNRWFLNYKHGLPYPLSLLPLQHSQCDLARDEWLEQGHHVFLDPCNSHLLHAHRHTHIHTDPITSRHHLHDCPAWPFILSWAVAEQPYTSADFWLTGREDTPTWSPFSSSTTPPSPQKPLPAPLLWSQEKTHLSQSVSEQEVS